MRTMRLLVILLFIGNGAHAAGGTAMDAYNFVTGARGAGMGGAVSAVVADPTALQWNPAGLARVPSFSASLSHLIWVADINYSYLGATAPLPLGLLGLPLKAVVGLSVQSLDYGPVESTRGLAEEAAASDLGLTFGTGVRIIEDWSAGVAVKYFRHVLDDVRVGETAMDLGLRYDAWPERASIAAVWQNVGYVEALGGHRPPLPMTLKLGGALNTGTVDMPIYGGSVEPMLTLRWLTLVSVDFTVQKGEPGSYNIGVESGVNELLFIRFGYLRHLEETGGSFPGANAGIGLQFRMLGSILKLDYAYGSVGDLGRAQYMTLSWAPQRKAGGTPSSVRPAAEAPVFDVRREYQAASQEYSMGQHAAAAARAKAIVAVEPGHWQAWQLLGNCRYAAGDGSGALEAYTESLKANPENPGLKDWVERIKAR